MPLQAVGREEGHDFVTDYLSNVLLSEYSDIFSKYDTKIFSHKLPTAALREEAERQAVLVTFMLPTDRWWVGVLIGTKFHPKT